MIIPERPAVERKVLAALDGADGTPRIPVLLGPCGCGRTSLLLRLRDLIGRSNAVYLDIERIATTPERCLAMVRQACPFPAHPYGAGPLQPGPRDAFDGPVHERAGDYSAVVKLRNGAAKQNVEVSYEFVDGTAKLGEDYKAAPSGTVTIKAGQTDARIPYTVLRVDGQQKQFTLQITAVKPGEIGKAVAVFTIGGKR